MTSTDPEFAARLDRIRARQAEAAPTAPPPNTRRSEVTRNLAVMGAIVVGLFVTVALLGAGPEIDPATGCPVVADAQPAAPSKPAVMSFDGKHKANGRKSIKSAVPSAADSMPTGCDH